MLQRAYIIPLFLLAISVATLAAVLISEYGFGYFPCKLCIYQRIPFVVLGVVSLLALVIQLLYKRNWNIGLLLIASVCFATSGAIAVYHVGVEQFWWQGSEGCVGTASGDSLEALKESLLQAPLVRCDEPMLIVFGLSMAAWNVLYSFALAVAALVGIRIIK